MSQTDDEIYKAGSLFEGWEIEEKIGEGSYGVVYKVSKREMGETYDSAVKVISIPTKEQFREVESSFGDDEVSMVDNFEDIVKNIIKEIKMLYSLGGNANIIGYQDHKVIKTEGELGWEILIRMEYATSIRKYLQEHSLTLEDVIKLGIDICTALEMCSKKGIIHCDIKEDNIFVSSDGVYKLGDFGIARELYTSGYASSMHGTLYNMAPEIYLGEKYNTVADLYSLGIVLYRLLNNGRMPLTPPYPEKLHYQDNGDAQKKRMNGAVLPNPANAQGKLAVTILKACAYKVSDRYSSSTEMKADLEKVLATLNDTQKNTLILAVARKTTEETINTDTDFEPVEGTPVESIPSETMSVIPNGPQDTFIDNGQRIREETFEVPFASEPQTYNIPVGKTSEEKLGGEDSKKTTSSVKKKRRKKIRAALLVIVAIEVITCILMYGKVTRIKLSETQLNIEIGNYQQVYANVTRFLKGTASEAVNWSSDDYRIAGVSQNGFIIAYGEGVTKIEASLSGKKAYCTVQTEYPTITIGSVTFRTNLTSLDLSGQGIKDISALSSCLNLETLNISDNDISDVSALAGLSKLTTLYLANNPIIEYSPLAGIFDHLNYSDFSIPDNKDSNLKNGGIFALSDDTVVFGGNKLYLLNKTLNEGDFIALDIGATNINILDGWIYYCIGWDGTSKTANSYLNLYKIKIDGTERQLLSKDECISVQIVGDHIYYSNREDNFSIYRIGTDGTGRQKLNSYDSIDLCVADSGIYYINRDDGNSIYQIPLDGGEGYKLLVKACKSLQLYNNSLYLIGEDDGCIYSLSLEQGLVKLNDDTCECFNISDGWIYYSNNSDGGKLYKVRLDGLGKQKLSDEDTCHTIHVIGDYVIYAYSTRDNSGSWVWHGYYKMSKDGSDKQKLPTMFHPCETIEFSDQHLSDAIRKQLQITESYIILGDTKGVTQLTLDSKNITSISGLEYFTDLKQLDLGENKIKDIGPLSDLTSLVELDLGNNQIEDISALRNLTHLEQLQIYSNKIKDISVLSSLPKLWYLLVVDNKITDISALGNLIDLTVLGLEVNQISDISSLRKLTKLEQLWLNNNKIKNIEVLQYFPELRRLFLSSNLIEDISPLAGLEHLELLYLANNPIKDYGPIAEYYDRLSEKDFDYK